MKHYEIYWHHLTDEAKEEFEGLYHDNIGLNPLAIIDIEEDSEEDSEEPTIPYEERRANDIIY